MYIAASGEKTISSVTFTLASLLLLILSLPDTCLNKIHCEIKSKVET